VFDLETYFIFLRSELIQKSLAQTFRPATRTEAVWDMRGDAVSVSSLRFAAVLEACACLDVKEVDPADDWQASIFSAPGLFFCEHS
jgi:hypothetical protein